MKKHSVRRKSIALGLVVAVAILAVALVALQHFHLLGDATPSTYHWRGGASSTVHGECISYGMSAANCWIEAQNWVEGSVPPSASIIVIDNNSITSPAIPSGASVTLGTVTMDSPNHSITNYGTIYDGAFSGTINNYDNINGGIFGGTITNFGGGYTDSIGTIRGGSFTGTVFNNGTIDATGIYYGPPDFTNATFTDIMGTYQCPSGKTWNTNQCANPTYHWVGGHSNNAWNVASNWQENSVPAGGADIEIGSSATTKVNQGRPSVHGHSMGH